MAAANIYFHCGLICWLFSNLISCLFGQKMPEHGEKFTKAQDVLICLVLATTRRYSVYYYIGIKKKNWKMFTFKQQESENLDLFCL